VSERYDRSRPDETGADQVSSGLSVAMPWQQQLATEAPGWQDLHDPLTGLAGSTIVIDRLRGALSRAQRSQLTVAVVVIGLDRMGSLNDELGWDAGSEILRRTAGALTRNLRSTDSAGRIGGDEFVVIADALATWEDAAAIAERLDDAVSAPMMIADRLIMMSACIGVAITAEATEEPDRLLRRACLAMRHEKRKSRDAR
jgi:diguanylate cyclase (GGDEF)-like protein